MGFVVKKSGTIADITSEGLIVQAPFNSATTIFSLANSATIGTTSANTAIGATNALQVNGTDQYASRAFPSLGLPSAVPYSMEIFLRTTATLGATSVGLFGWVDGTSGDWSLFHKGASGALAFGLNGSSVANGVSASSGTLTTNVWNHVAVGYDGTNLSIFLNGSRIATRTYSTTAYGGSAAGTLYIGSDGATAQEHTGQVCGFRLCIGSTLIDPSGTTITVPPTLFGLTP